MNSRLAVDVLLDVDPGFQSLCKTLLGDAVDPADVWEFMYGPSPVVKMSDPSEVHVNNAGSRKGMRYRVRRAVAGKRGAAVASAASGAAGVLAGSAASRYASGSGVNVPGFGSSNQYGYSVSGPLTRQAKADDSDSVDVTWSGEFAKSDDEKRQVFGWASVVALDGVPIVDRQGDLIAPDEIEKAAYAYVHQSRKGGHQHRRTDDDQPFHASDMIESIVFTPEKIAKMGLPSDFPVGWWVGYKVNDDETWERIKSGEVTSFSIHGKGRRAPVGV